MELTLQDRDRVGVEDFVLLEDYTSIEAFIDNLRKRHRENLIYTSIGHVLISVNPFKSLPIYGDDVIREYSKSGFMGSAPHVYAVADTAYRSMTEQSIGQCILISGESGAGKTEASKKVLQYLAAAANNKGRVVAVKDKLLHSNPVLEAFGNAKTNKNDNSSRFGKYMDISFDFKGEPVGGNIINYLLEKSRVVFQASNERNFHIFYQLLAGASDEQLQKLLLVRDRESYAYLQYDDSQSENDAAQFREVCRALSIMEFTEEEQSHLFEIVASILHLGNVQFVENEDGIASVSDLEPIKCISKLLGCDGEALALSLTQQTLHASRDTVLKPHTIDFGLFARDALAKALYDRLFTWLVGRINSSILAPRSDTAAIGILDIYGFEVFQNNSFEQFCINFCNEKLQQVFIKLTLKHEQDEYHKEGIEWVQVEFFDNKIICDMIEEKHKGIISMMDEVLALPEPSDMRLLTKMNHHFSNHRHYFSHEKSDTKTQKTMEPNQFRLVHYAGEVTYSIVTFLAKNRDLLFRDLCEVMHKTENSITKVVFTEEELQRKKRPDTAITKFHRSLNELTIILCNKTPSYIRCIRPNDTKSPSSFDDPIVRHQVQYLGLMENLRVRRAGFAYRRPYDQFLMRYKSLSKNTWPNFKGSPKQGVQVLVNDLGYTSEEYRMGTTKLFIRSPNTLFKTEDAFQEHKHFIASIIQKMWKGRKQRQAFLRIREAVISIERIVRGFLARREAERRRKAVNVIRRFVTGFITRNGPETDINQKFVRIAKVQWLKRLAKNLPKHLLDKSWPKCPGVCEEASAKLHQMHTLQLARTYRNKLSPIQKYNFELKVLAKELFEGKKETYPKSFGKWFLDNRIDGSDQTDLLESFIKSDLRGQKLVYATSITKLDRHGYKNRRRVVLITDTYLYLLDPKTGKQKHCLPHNAVTELTVTAGLNDLLVIGILPDLKKDKGDLILMVPYLIETVTTFIKLSKSSLLKIVPDGEIHHNLANGRAGIIRILPGPLPKHEKSKGGELIIKG